MCVALRRSALGPVGGLATPGLGGVVVGGWLYVCWRCAASFSSLAPSPAPRNKSSRTHVPRKKTQGAASCAAPAQSGDEDTPSSLLEENATGCASGTGAGACLSSSGPAIKLIDPIRDCKKSAAASGSDVCVAESGESEKGNEQGGNGRGGGGGSGPEHGRVAELRDVAVEVKGV